MYKTSDHPTQLDDICDAGYGERVEHFLYNFAGNDSDKRIQVARMCNELATGEMLDEIHTMLRHLCFEKDKE